MNQELQDFIPTSCELLALGEPTHLEPAFGWVRNLLFAQLVERGFRSIALETEQVAAFIVNDFVQTGQGDLDTVMREGFTHEFGNLAPNRQLVAWMREYNQNRPSAEQLAFHGFDAPMDTMSPPSPRRYLEHARDYLDLDIDLASLLGEDELWSRTEAVMDSHLSIGDTAESARLRVIADDMLTGLYAQAPERIATTSRAQWIRAKANLVAGLGLLRYHKQSAQPLEMNERISRLGGIRDALMAQNLLDIRDLEAERGEVLVHSHNSHLQRHATRMSTPDLELHWAGAGAILGSLLGDRYAFVAGSLGRSDTIELAEPDPDTFEGVLQTRFDTWGLTATTPDTKPRTDSQLMHHFPLTSELLDSCDAVLHINDGRATAKSVMDGLSPEAAE